MIVRQNMTETLRLALQFAQANARNMNQEFVGTEHILLGLLDCEACEATDVLRGESLDRRALRAALLQALPKGDAPPVVVGELPLSPKAQRMIQNALVRADELREPAVSSRVVLLALLEEPGTVSRDVIKKAGGDIEHLQQLLRNRPENGEA
jgi:ATP-dependent Clp protease ATP-binding subunit ClpC